MAKCKALTGSAVKGLKQLYLNTNLIDLAFVDIARVYQFHLLTS